MTAAPDQPLPVPFLLLRRDLGIPFAAPAWPPGVTLAPLAASDAPAIHALLQRAYANGHGSVAADRLSWWEAIIGDCEFDPALCFVAKAGETVVGFCLCWTSSFIKDLVVDPDWQARGVGTALLIEACTALRHRGATSVALKVVAANTAAQRLYERFGFGQA